MIRAYDEYGNIIDLVEWEKQIRAKAIDDFTEKLMEQQIYGCMLPDGFRTDIVTSHTIDAIAEQIKAGDGK